MTIDEYENLRRTYEALDSVMQGILGEIKTVNLLSHYSPEEEEIAEYEERLNSSLYDSSLAYLLPTNNEILSNYAVNHKGYENLRECLKEEFPLEAKLVFGYDKVIVIIYFNNKVLTFNEYEIN